MAATLGLGDKARLGSRSASPATNCELVEYIQKSNRTIKLLQEELHSASQVAIRLSHKYEAKRAERDEIAEQLSTVFRQNETLQEQLQLLCAFITQQCKQLEVPKAVAAVLAEHSKPHSASSKHSDQQPETAAAGSRQPTGTSTDTTAGQLDTAHKSPRLAPGRLSAVTATAPQSAATAKQTVLHQHVTANVRHTTAANAAAGPVSASGARAKGKPPLSAAINQQPTGRAATNASPASPAAITSNTSSVLLTSRTSSKESPKLEAPGQQRNANAAKPAGLGLLLTAASAPSTLPAAGAVGSRTARTPMAAGVASPPSPQQTQEVAGRSNDGGTTAAAAAPFSFGSGTVWLAGVADIPAADSKQTTSSPQQQQIQQQLPQQQKPGSKPSSALSSPGKTSSNQISPTTSSPRQQQQHWQHLQQQQQRKSSPLNSPGKSERSSSGRLSQVISSNIQSVGNDAPMPSARTLTCNSDSTAEALLRCGSTAVLRAVASEHAGVSASLANPAGIASPIKRGAIALREAVEQCNSDTEDSDTSEGTSGSNSSASNSDAAECSSGNSSSTNDEDGPRSTPTGHHSLLAAAAGSPMQHGALVSTQDSDKGITDMPPGPRHASAWSRANAASAETLRTSPSKASSKPNAISRGGSLTSSSSCGSSSDAEDVGSSSSSNAGESEQEVCGESSPSGTTGPAPGRQRNVMSIQLPSTLDSDSEGNSEGDASSCDDQHDSSEGAEHEADSSIHGSTSLVSTSAGDGSNIDNSSEDEQEVGQEEQEPVTPGSGRLQDLQQPMSIFGNDPHQGNPAAGQHSAAQSPVHTPTGNLDSSPSDHVEPRPAASPLQEQQLSMRSSGSFHSAAASPRSRRSSYSSSLYSACSRSTRVSQSSLGLTASLLEPDNSGLLLEQTSSAYSQYRISADGAGSQGAQQQQQQQPEEGGGGVTDWPRVKQPAVPHSTAAAAVGSSSGAGGPSLTTSPSGCRSAAAAAVTTAASAAAAVAAVSATTITEASTQSSRSDGPSSGYSSNFATARSRGTTGGAAAGPATPAAVAAVHTAHDSAFGSFVSEGGSIFGFVGDAFSSLQHAVSSAGNVAAAAAAVMGALPAGTHCAATDGVSSTTNSRASWLKSPRGQRSVLAAASQPPPQQSVFQHDAQQQQWQAGGILGASSFGGFPPAGSSIGSSGGRYADADCSASPRRSSQGGRVPALTRHIASTARGLSNDDAKQAADEQHQQPPVTNTDEEGQHSTNLLLFDKHQQSSSRGDFNSAGGEQPQLQGVAGSSHPLVEPLGGQAVTVQRHLDTAAPLDNPQRGGGLGSLFSGTASSGATSVPQQTLASTPSAGPGPIHRALTPRTAGGGAPPTSAAGGAGIGQPFGIGGQPQPFLFGTPFQQPQQQPQTEVTKAAPFTFGAAAPTKQQQSPQSASLPAPTFVFGGPTVGQQQQRQHPGTADLPKHSAGSKRASSSDGAKLFSTAGSDSEGPPANKGSVRQSNAFDVLAGDSDAYDSDAGGDDASSWEETSDDE